MLFLDLGVRNMTLRKIVAASVCLALSTSALAAQINCVGNVSKLYVSKANSGVYILGSYSPNWTKVCQIDATWKGVTAETCKFWFSIAQGSYHAETQVNLAYDSSEISSCSTIPTYSNAPSPKYLMLY